MSEIENITKEPEVVKKEEIEIKVSPKKNCNKCSEYGTLKVKFMQPPPGLFGGGAGKIICKGGINTIINCACVVNNFNRKLKEMGIKTETRKEKPEHDYEKNFYYDKAGKEITTKLTLINNRVRPEPKKEEENKEK